MLQKPWECWGSGPCWSQLESLSLWSPCHTRCWPLHISIWLNQAVRGFRDRQGNAVPHGGPPAGALPQDLQAALLQVGVHHCETLSSSCSFVTSISSSSTVVEFSDISWPTTTN